MRLRTSSISRTWGYPGRTTRRYWNGRRKREVLLTHDVATITRYAYERVRDGKPMPGVFEVGRSVPIGRAIEDMLLLAEYSLDGEWAGQVRYLPLR